MKKWRRSITDRETLTRTRNVHLASGHEIGTGTGHAGARSCLLTLGNQLDQAERPMKVSAIYTWVTVLTAAATGLLPISSYGYALDPQLDCRSNAHAFIAPLLKDRYIDPKPMRVEANSVNAFRLAHGSNLTAFGFRVYAVLGYEHGDALFKRGDGQPVADPAYGAVVIGAAESVEAHARQAGSRAVIHQVVPLLLTAIFCSGP